MDSLTRCEKGHYYDSMKHSSCPFCGVQDLDIDIHKTMAKRPSASEKVIKEENKTVGIYKKKLGLDPVVGWLVAVDGPQKGHDFRITAERNFIGRSDKMDISIPDDDSISRENHAVVSFNPKNQVFRLFPGEGKGLVYHNGDEVVTPVALAAYDFIEIGQSKLVFVPLCGDNFWWEKPE